MSKDDIIAYYHQVLNDQVISRKLDLFWFIKSWNRYKKNNHLNQVFQTFLACDVTAILTYTPKQKFNECIH